MRFLSTKHIAAVIVAAFLLAGPLGGVAFAGASRSNPANTKAKASCSSFEIPKQIQGGGNDGKWYCEPKSAPQGGGSGGGGGGSGSGISGSNTPADQAACAGLSQLDGPGCNGNAGQNTVASVASRVVQILSYIAGIIGIIMVIVSGIRFTTSGGDSAKVGSAKTALVYALIGLAVAALAQVFVHLVLNQTG